MAGEERTKEVFGDYISVYNFKQSIDDGNTVPLYYENRIPELQLVNENLAEDIAEIVESAELSDDQQAKRVREMKVIRVRAIVSHQQPARESRPDFMKSSARRGPCQLRHQDVEVPVEDVKHGGSTP